MFSRSFLLGGSLPPASTLWTQRLFAGRAHQDQRQPKRSLEQGLKKQFPKQFPIAGLLQLECSDPHCSCCRPATSCKRIGWCNCRARRCARALAGRMRRARLACTTSQRSAACAPNVWKLTVAAAGKDAIPAMAEMVRTYRPACGPTSLARFCAVHRQAREMELMDNLGLRPGAITVTGQGLDVAVLKPSLPQRPSNHQEPVWGRLGRWCARGKRINIGSLTHERPQRWCCGVGR